MSKKELFEKRIKELTSLYGIGDVMAERMLKKGIYGQKLDINKPMRGQLRNKKIYKFLPDATRADLKYNPSRKIPREIIKKIDSDFKRILKGVRYDIGGSYKRRKPISRDLDLIISNKSNKPTEDLWNEFKNKIHSGSKRIEFKKPFAIGPGKASVILVFTKSDGKKIKIKTDVFFTPPDEYLFMLLYVTGSGQFNILMRVQAKRKGYLLNQKGLYKRKGDKLIKVPIKSEKDIFALLNMKWREPHQRNK